MKNTFCVLPFTHLATHPNGDVTPCCESKLKPKNGDKILNLNTDSIDDIRNSDTFTKLRKELKDGIESKTCEFCWKAERDGLESKRIRENLRFGVNEITQPYFEKNQPLLNIELRLGNICNTKCLICSPGSSSKWNEDTKAFRFINDPNLADYQHMVVIPKEWYRSDDIYSDIANQPMLKHLWFNGGEPTLIKEHFLFLKKLIDNGSSKKITLEYNINGSYMPDDLISLWKEFFHVYVTISLDDIGDRLYYSRFPTQFQIVSKTIEKLENHSITYTLIPTISILNIFNVVNIYNYFIENFKNGNSPGINFVKHPYFLSIGNLSDEHKELVLRNIENSTLPDMWVDFIKHSMSEPSKIGYGSFIKYITTIDKQRNLSILDYLPEFKLMFDNHKLL